MTNAIASEDDHDFSLEALDRRITFDLNREIMEIDLSGLHFFDKSDVNTFYDRVEDRIRDTSEIHWFFLIDYSGTRIDPEAWIAWSRRGKVVNKAHSMGTVRVDASPETRAQIERAAGTDAFDPNLFSDRDAAVRRLATLPSTRVHQTVHVPSYPSEEHARRIVFLPEDEIMEVDFHDFVFHHRRDVDDFYDEAERRIMATGRKWYFLINYNNCRIEPAAWVEFARRGKELNIGGSLGSVRYAAGSETEADIRLRASSQGFRPNIRNTRTEALERIAEMKAEAAQR
ncbi:MAG: hypothetical protein AAFR35_09245 [Pseudomonadota bacterium]